METAKAVFHQFLCSSVGMFVYVVYVGRPIKNGDRPEIHASILRSTSVNLKTRQFGQIS